MRVSVWPKIILAAFLIISTWTNRVNAGTALTAAPATFQWDSSPDTSVTGYAMYYGINGSGVTNRIDAGNVTTLTIRTLLASSNYFLFVVAYNASGMESEPSNVLLYEPPVMAHFQINQTVDGINIGFTIATTTCCRIEYTPTLNPPHWQTLADAIPDANGNVSIIDPVTDKPTTRFYRVVGP